MKNNLIKIYSIYVVIFLFLISSVTPMVFGYNGESSCSSTAENNIFEISTGPMDSPWPMKCHDNRHTGLSPYSTADNPGIEKWRFKCGWVEDGIAIGDDGTLYFGDYSAYLYAVYPDGTLNWKYKTGEAITSCPAIAEDGTIYVSAWNNYLYALYPNGTRKWRFNANSASISSSPAIDEDGTIYFGTLSSLGKGNKIHAVNPDGTEKWRYQTGSDIISSPAIGSDGTIYIGSQDSYLYAMYPNGTLRWRFKTGNYVNCHPSIAEDGTIYFGSYDDYLYALNPDGTLKWKIEGVAPSGSPSIGSDGTIYVGGDKLYAINPNGAIKWSIDLSNEQYVGFSSPAISGDGTIYIGTRTLYHHTDGGEIIAVNPDGTVKWRKRIANWYVSSSPCIGKDGTVYIGSNYDMGEGYLHAFGSVESNEPPETPTISGDTNGKPFEFYEYEITAVDPDNHPVSFYIDWGDGFEGWVSERASGEKCRYMHTWLIPGRHTIRVKAKDVMGAESDWATLEVAMPKNRLNHNIWILFDWLKDFFDIDFFTEE